MSGQADRNHRKVWERRVRAQQEEKDRQARDMVTLRKAEKLLYPVMAATANCNYPVTDDQRPPSETVTYAGCGSRVRVTMRTTVKWRGGSEDTIS